MIEIARYSLPLAQPMRFAGQTLTRRDGFFVRIDRAGVGEVAPMPGLHRENVAECIALLKVHGLRGIDRFPPPLAFGVSCAMCWDAPILRSPLRDAVGVNALFSGDSAAALRAVEEGRLTGFRTVKVKVRRCEDRATIETLLRELPSQVRLRIDANRGLSFEDAVALLAGLDPRRIEYVEEPLVEPLRLPELHFATGQAIALDESLLEPQTRAAIETAPGITTHLLKPSLHGTIERVRERAERTARQGLRTTLSNAFESAFTLRLIARLATWLPNADGDHGLGTAGFLVGDPTSRPLIRDGYISTTEPLTTPQIPFVAIEDCDAS